MQAEGHLPVQMQAEATALGHHVLAHAGASLQVPGPPAGLSGEVMVHIVADHHSASRQVNIGHVATPFAGEPKPHVR